MFKRTEILKLKTKCALPSLNLMKNIDPFDFSDLRKGSRRGPRHPVTSVGRVSAVARSLAADGGRSGGFLEEHCRQHWTEEGTVAVGRSVGRSTAAIRTYIARRRREESRGAASVASRMRRAEEGRAGGREAQRRGGERERARDDRRRSCCRCDEQGSINEVEERSGAGRSGSERASERGSERGWPKRY